ncbi:hypothetical protein [Bdellovibrio sp. HCB-110]|uniref:hypothetical protein n=1 Tax=Bdellovibrio sp. HCB-110 TaxID=3391182 RepID=UPI0039B4CC89
MFSLIDNEYEDTRIDYDLDNNIDFWRIKKGDLVIEVYFQKNVSVYHIRHIKNNSVSERILFAKDGAFNVAYAVQRKQFVYNFTSEGPLCSSNQKAEWEKLKASFSQISKNNISISVENFIGEQCYKELDAPVYKKLRDVSSEVFSPPGTNDNSLLSCLESPEVGKYFINTFGEKDGPLNHEKAIIGFKNSIIKFVDLGKTSESPVLSCKKVEELTPKNPMKVTESGKQIQFQFGKNISEVSNQDLKAQLFHESLHISSLKNEKLNDAITNFCVNGKKSNEKINKAELASQLSDASKFTSSTFTSELDILNGEKIAANSASQKIPKSVAETPLNPSKDKSPVDMNRMADAAGTATVAEVSKAQTSGVVRMAESVLGSTPAVAAEPTSLASSSSTTSGSGTSSSGSSSSSSSYASSPSYSASSTSSSDDSRPARRVSDSSRSPASDYQLDMSTVGAKAPTVKIAASANGNSLGKGEYIKEEVDLTKPAVTPSSSVGRVPASTKTGSSDVSASASSQTNNTEQASSSGGGSYGAAGRGASSANLSSGSQSSNESTSTSPQRRGTSSQTAGGSYVPSRDEVVSFFSGGSYQQARGKLKDQGFVQTLKKNNITVYDLGGNTYGASKGEIIFVDQGDRFVRQK